MQKRIQLILIGILLLGLGVGSWYLFKDERLAQDVPVIPDSVPTDTPDTADMSADVPVINSITPNNVRVGTIIEVRGKNFPGFEADLALWIENAQGVKGILFDEHHTSRGPEDTGLIRAELPQRLCQKDTSYTGDECDAFLDLVPGIYKVYVEPWGVRSNVVELVIQ